MKQRACGVSQINQASFYKFKGHKIIQQQITQNKIIFLTETILMVLNIESNGSITENMIDGTHVVKFGVNSSSRANIAILYDSSQLEIRKLDSFSTVLHKFKEIEYGPLKQPIQKISKNEEKKIKNKKCKFNPQALQQPKFPKICWNNDDICLLYEEKLEIINPIKKERKVYTDIITSLDGEKIENMVQSNIIQSERIVVMQFPTKLTFNIVPIPIATMPLQRLINCRPTLQAKITAIKAISVTTALVADGNLLRQYLLLTINHTKLQVYNIISMKLILQVEYQTKKGEEIILQTDAFNEYLILTFVSSGSVNRNILYKLNVDYYYRTTSEYFTEEEPFFVWELEIPIKYQLMLFPSHSSIVKGIEKTSIDMCYFKHNQVDGFGDIILASTLVPSDYRTPISRAKFLCPSWKQLREWKDMITSYIEMKNSLDKLDFGFDDEEEIKDSIQAQEGKNENEKREKMSKFPYFDDEDDRKLMEQYDKSTQEIEEQERQFEKYQRLKLNLQNAAKKFQDEKFDQIVSVGLGSSEENEKKLEEEFYKFMKQYLKEQEIDVNPDDLFLEIERVDKKESEIIVRESTPEDNLKYSKKNWPKHEQPKHEQPKHEQPKPEQQVPLKKTVEQQVPLKKTVSNSSLLNLTKSSAENIETPKVNNSMHCNRINILSESYEQKNANSSYLQELKEEHALTNEEFEEQNFDEEQQQFDKMTLSICNAIQKGFQPLQDKIEKMSNQMYQFERIHVSQIKKCASLMQREEKYLGNLDSTISGYCHELMGQFNRSLDNGLKSYWEKIQQIDKRASKERDKTINQFGKFIDNQIKSREAIFDSSRLSIENNLSHLRKKMASLSRSQEQLIEKQYEPQVAFLKHFKSRMP